MLRVYHDYRRWEDFKAGMWRKVDVTEFNKLLPVAIEFTKNHIKYGNAMLRVIKIWKYSCEHNLTNSSANRKAWIGHAACCLELKLPESVVRRAWKFLTNEQRRLANEQAEIAINKWTENYKNKYQLNLW